MSLSPARRNDAMARLARPSGAFAMVAMDQRESLRAMLAEHLSGPVGVGRRVAFKVAVARLLSPHASALLLDMGEGVIPVLEAGALDPECALIVAADALVQPEGGLVDDTLLDEEIDLTHAASLGAVAAKLLVIWRSDRPAGVRQDLVRAFIERSHSAGLLAIVEGVVRPPNGIAEARWSDREAAVLEAARELGDLGPDIYKAQVPFNGVVAASEVTKACRAITDVLACPWVVLSSGVAIEAFPAAAEAACRGGASGFLAGRAVWRDALGEDPGPALRERSVPRLVQLGAIVDRAARPWSEAGSAAAGDIAPAR